MNATPDMWAWGLTAVRTLGGFVFGVLVVLWCCRPGHRVDAEGVVVNEAYVVLGTAWASGFAIGALIAAIRRALGL